MAGMFSRQNMVNLYLHCSPTSCSFVGESLTGPPISQRANNRQSVTSKGGEQTCPRRNAAVPALGASLNPCETRGRRRLTLSSVVKCAHRSEIVPTITFEKTLFVCRFAGKAHQPVLPSTGNKPQLLLSECRDFTGTAERYICRPALHFNANELFHWYQ